MKSKITVSLKDLIRDRMEVSSGHPMQQGHMANMPERMETGPEENPGLKIDMGPISEVLQDDVFPLDEGPVSRVRLIQALMRKFGEGFKVVPAAKAALDHYDRESDTIKVIKANRRKYHG